MRHTAAVFLAGLIILGWGAGRPGIATAYVDPVGHIQAQDEAVYGSTSFEMARGGAWLTPKFLGRYALYKPPLLYWLSAACVKIVGRSAWALRIPSIVAGAATIALVFAWLEPVSITAGLVGAVLLMSSHLFFVLSRVGLMDSLLVFAITLALFVVSRDRQLDSAGSRWIFGVATGAAIMTKAVTGVFPVLILIGAGVSFVRLVQVCAIAAAVAAPWHLLQFYVHPRWFWAEYVLSEHLTWGLSAPEQSTLESPGGYYAKRLFALDPVLLIAAIVAAWKTRPRLLISWIAVVVVAVFAWQYRNASYLAPVYPALAILSAMAIPAKYGRTALVVAAAILIAKIALPRQPFGIPFGAESANPSHAALRAYADLHRPNDLVIVEPDDQFYSADLGLAKVRYVWISKIASRPRLPLDFEYLGITVSAKTFLRLGELRPMFVQRLREWGLDSADPLATVILAETQEEVQSLMTANPQSDFFVKGKFLLAANHGYDLAK